MLLVFKLPIKMILKFTKILFKANKSIEIKSNQSGNVKCVSHFSIIFQLKFYSQLIAVYS